jgi:hypothetical protein
MAGREQVGVDSTMSRWKLRRKSIGYDACRILSVVVCGQRNMLKLCGQRNMLKLWPAQHAETVASATC